MTAAPAASSPPGTDDPGPRGPNAGSGPRGPNAGSGPLRDPMERESPLAVGVVVWLASELMFFGGLFAAWFVLKAANEPNWPPPGEGFEPLRMGLFTAVLIASSFTIHVAVDAAEHRRARATLRWLAVTIALGTAFIIHSLYEWYELPFRFDTSAFSSIFFLLTGFHGLHVLGGLVLMAVVAWVVLTPGSRVPMGRSVRITSYYWHFVDAVWIVLYIVVYLLQ
jgi:cytochrome c oxidase subunit 3